MSLLNEISKSIINLKPKDTEELTKKATEKFSPIEILNNGLIEGMKVIGEKFKNNEIYLPEVMVAAKAFKMGFAVIEKSLKSGKFRSKGKIVIGTVKDDIHDIGKNIVASLLRGNGFEVIDAGVDVPSSKFADLVKKENPEIVALSALLTTTMRNMEEIIKTVKEVKPDVKVIVGGAPLTEEFAKTIGADGYAPDAQTAVSVVEKLIS